MKEVSCNKCGVVIDAVWGAYDTVKPGTQLLKTMDALKDIKPRMESEGLCAPVCLPLLDLLAKADNMGV